MGADKGYDTREFTTLTPHVAMKQGPADEPSRGVRGESASAEAGRGGVRLAEDRRTALLGVARNGLWAEMALAAYNLVLSSCPRSALQ